ncbi:Trk system potassium uptake protein TrkH [bioreactor metagenome]|uniref:Trk system potassium uptake protein TrkH n=1 Tax=bioreactor metagenome TaxID=1076179 RepID=A0A645DLF9_9ZZZZ
MILFGVNFNLYFYLLVKNFRSVYKNEELRLYLGVIFAAVLAIAVNILPLYEDLAYSLRASFFQVSSIITTTGFATADFNLWPSFSKSILLILMFFGASAGSTGGGIKISRILLIGRMIRREMLRLLHPRSVGIIKLEDKTVDDETLHGVNIFILLYLVIIVVSLLALSLDGFDFETNFSSIAACLNNIGPGFQVVGPMGNYSSYSLLSKLVLSMNMLLGRLEIFPILLALMPSFWKRK